MVVRFMYEFFGCDYCILLTINMLRHVEVVYPVVKLIKKVLCLFTLHVITVSHVLNFTEMTDVVRRRH